MNRENSEDKSYVSMERRICVVCGYEYNTNNLLMDRRLRPSLEKHTTTGYGLCPKHKEMSKKYIALVEVSNDPSVGYDSMKIEDAIRTGAVAHVSRTVADHIFNTKFPEDPVFIYTEIGVIDRLRSLQTRTTS